VLSPPHAALLKIWYIVFFVWTSIGAYASIQYNFMVGSLGFSTEEALVPGFFGQGAAIVGALVASVRNQPRFRVCVCLCVCVCVCVSRFVSKEKRGSFAKTGSGQTDDGSPPTGTQKKNTDRFSRRQRSRGSAAGAPFAGL
jgi:hypothetical protein